MFVLDLLCSLYHEHFPKLFFRAIYEIDLNEISVDNEKECTVGELIKIKGEFKNTAKRNMSSAVWASSMCKMF